MSETGAAPPRLRRSPLVVAMVGLAVTVGLAACGATSLPILPYNPHPPVTLQVDWRVDLVDNGFFLYEPTETGQLGASPDGRVVYMGVSDGRFVAVDAGTGEVRWEHHMDEPVDGMPVVDRGELFVGAADGRLYSLDAAGGAERWSLQVGGNLDSRPAVTSDVVVLGTPAGSIVCVDRRTGQMRWTVEDNDPILRVVRGLHPPVKGQASPLVREGRVYGGFPGGRLSAVDLTSGTTVWTTDLAGDAVRHTDVDERPAWAGDRLFASSFAGGLYAINPNDGAIFWRNPLRGATAPVVYGDHLLTTTTDGRYRAISLADGSSLFSVELEGQGPGRVILFGDYAIVPTRTGPLYIMDAGAPHIHARFSQDDGFASAVALPNSRIVALDNQGVLFGLTLRLQ